MRYREIKGFPKEKFEEEIIKPLNFSPLLGDYENGYNQALKDCDLEIPMLSREEIKAESARGYCDPRNEHKVLDPDLLDAIGNCIHEAMLKKVKGEGQ